MKVSNLIRRLQFILKTEGDIQVIRHDGKPVGCVDVLDQLGAVVSTAPSSLDLYKPERIEKHAAQMRKEAKDRKAHIEKLREMQKRRRKEYLEETEKQPYVH